MDWNVISQSTVEALALFIQFVSYESRPEKLKKLRYDDYSCEMRYLDAFCPQCRFSLALMNRITRCLLAISFSWGDTPTHFFTTLLIFSEY